MCSVALSGPRASRAAAMWWACIPRLWHPRHPRACIRMRMDGQRFPALSIVATTVQRRSDALKSLMQMVWPIRRQATAGSAEREDVPGYRCSVRTYLDQFWPSFAAAVVLAGITSWIIAPSTVALRLATNVAAGDYDDDLLLFGRKTFTVADVFGARAGCAPRRIQVGLYPVTFGEVLCGRRTLMLHAEGGRGMGAPWLVVVRVSVWSRVVALAAT